MATYVAVFALVLAYLAASAAFFALRTLARLRRDTYLLARGTRGPNGQQSLIEVTSRHAELTASLQDEVSELRGQLQAVETASREAIEAARQEALAAISAQAGTEAGAVRHVALVRYDAFAELSGRTSFSVALLDDRGDGLTISAIAGRSDTRVYAKAVAGGAGEHELTPEERQAVSSAMGTPRRFRKAG